LLEVTVSPLGVEVSSVVTAAGAREAIAAALPDVVLLDIGLPDGNGVDVLEWVRSRPEFDNVRVVMASGIADAAVVERALNEGAVAYLAKPYRPEDVRSIVARILNIPSAVHA
jgi:CheY-like chemotaxis protein